MITAVKQGIEKPNKLKKGIGKNTLPPKGPVFGQHRITEIPGSGRNQIHQKA